MESLSSYFFDPSREEEKALDKQTLKLVYKVILKSTKDKRKYFETWDRTQLLNEGYSELIVAKARQYDRIPQDINLTGLAIFVIFIPGIIRWLIGLFLLVLACVVSFRKQSRYRKTRLSHADNLLILEELKSKLGNDFSIDYQVPVEHPLLEAWNRRLEKRALFWRLDHFLSRKS